MPDLNKPIREEITRLTRKELKETRQTQKKINVSLKKALAAMKAECAELRRTMNAFQKCLPKPPAVKTPDISDGKLKRFRPTSTTVKTLRAKLGLSQADFATLLGVSGQSVYMWERKEGQLQLRGNAKAALFALRTLGKREVKARLSELSEG